MQSHVIDVVLSSIDIEIYILLHALTLARIVQHSMCRLVRLPSVNAVSIDFGGLLSPEPHVCGTRIISIFVIHKAQTFHRLHSAD